VNLRRNVAVRSYRSRPAQAIEVVPPASLKKSAVITVAAIAPTIARPTEFPECDAAVLASPVWHGSAHNPTMWRRAQDRAEQAEERYPEMSRPTIAITNG
jgi:hypothetical protein